MFVLVYICSYVYPTDKMDWYIIVSENEVLS